MSSQRLRRPGEDEEEKAPASAEGRDEDQEERRGDRDNDPEPLDSGTVVALRRADPGQRAQALLRLQRLHGNQAVQRVIRSLQVTDAGRDARIQAIGDRAEEPAPSGKVDKAVLYREAIEAELEAAPTGSKTERELLQDNVNTVGQIFTNYQAALHQFEAAMVGGAGEAVPRELAKEMLREAAREVFEPVLAAATNLAPGFEDVVAGGMGKVGDVPMEEPKEPGQSAPAHILRNLVIAERRRVAGTQGRMMRGQVHFLKLAEEKVAGADGAGRAEYRARLAAANGDLNEMEATSHSTEQLLKKMMERWKDLAKGDAVVTIVLDDRWRVVRAHLKVTNGSRLASELLQAQSGNFDLNDLRLPRHVTWEPAELAICEAVLNADGVPVRLNRNERGGQFFEEFQQKLRVDKLPRTRVLTGD
jgi:hypothetical protein